MVRISPRQRKKRDTRKEVAKHNLITAERMLVLFVLNALHVDAAEYRTTMNTPYQSRRQAGQTKITTANRRRKCYCLLASLDVLSFNIV